MRIVNHNIKRQIEVVNNNDFEGNTANDDDESGENNNKNTRNKR